MIHHVTLEGDGSCEAESLSGRLDSNGFVITAHGEYKLPNDALDALKARNGDNVEITVLRDSANSLNSQVVFAEVGENEWSHPNILKDATKGFKVRV